MRRFASSHLLFTLPALFISLLLSCCTAKVSSETKTYTVTFHSNGGIEISTQTVSEGRTATQLTDPTREGYTFVSWHTHATIQDATTLFDFANTKITEDITLYAKWSKIVTHTVTFNTNGGSNVAPIENVAHGSTIERPTNPTKSGFYFVRWYKESTLKNVFKFKEEEGAEKITGDLTLYAKWTNTSYTVAFEPNNGTPIEPQTIGEGGTATQPADPTRSGYVFKGWYTENTFKNLFSFSTAITGDLTLYAQWNQLHTITFNTHDGSNIDPIKVENDSTIKKPADPTREGYTFSGWYKDKELKTVFDFANTKITGDITLYAKWTIKTYTITFNTNEGSTINPINVAHGSTVTKPTDPTREGYTFDNWYTHGTTQDNNTLFDFTSTQITGDLTLYAKWTIKTYTVTFNTDGGSSITPIENVARGSTIEEPTDDPTKAGSLFKGWYSDKGLTKEFEFTTPINSDTTLYAKWSLILTFDEETQTITGLTDEGKAIQSLNLVIPDTINGTAVKTIGKVAFKKILTLKSVTIPTGVTSIDSAAFHECESLTDIELPNSLKTIKEFAFAGCTKLANIDLPTGLTTIGSGAFQGCETLTRIDIPEGVTDLGIATFYACSNLAEISIPKGITYIGIKLFQNCYKLTGIDLPEGITYIGDEAFRRCGLTRISLPSTLDSIGAAAFYICSNLTDIEIPADVTKIKEYAFNRCKKLNMKFLGADPCNIGGDVFNQVLSILVPKGRKATYEAYSNWSKWSAIILEYE